MIDKGKVSAIYESGAKATVIPSTAHDTVTIQLVVPRLLEESLTVGMEVVYATFDDNTGIILARLDGDWSHKIKDDVTVEADITSSGDIDTTADVTASGISLGTHTHGGVTTGEGSTGGPQ